MPEQNTEQDPQVIEIPAHTSVGLYSLSQQIDTARRQLADALATLAVARIELTRDDTEHHQSAARRRLDRLFASIADCESMLAREAHDWKRKQWNDEGPRQWIGYTVRQDDIPF